MAAQLPAVITPALLASIRKQPHLPRNTWYFVAATTLAVLNRPDEIPTVYKHVLTHGVDHGTEGAPSPEEQLTISRRMREALVKTAAIGGLPKVSCLQDKQGSACLASFMSPTLHPGTYPSVAPT